MMKNNNTYSLHRGMKAQKAMITPDHTLFMKDCEEGKIQVECTK